MMAEETTGLTIGIPREADENERRVAIVPATVPALQKLGLRVMIEAGAGVAAGFLAVRTEFKSPDGRNQINATFDS